MQPDPHSGEAPQTFIFVLLNEFSVLSLSCAMEMMGSPTGWPERPYSGGGSSRKAAKAVKSSLGAEFPVDCGLGDAKEQESILVCGGANIQRASTKPVLHWLRRQAAHGATIGGLCTASYTLAKAGLLEGRKATIHWENQGSFTEEFPDIELSHSPYVLDGKRYSTAGGRLPSIWC